MNETLKTSVEKLDRYDGTSKFSTFAIGIAKNKIKEKIRKKSKQINIETKLTDAINLHGKDPLTIILDKEEKEAINNAISYLSKNHRQIIQLRMNGMSSKEIAEMTNKTVDAIDSMYRRALKALINNFDNIYY